MLAPFINQLVWEILRKFNKKNISSQNNETYIYKFSRAYLIYSALGVLLCFILSFVGILTGKSFLFYFPLIIGFILILITVASNAYKFTISKNYLKTEFFFISKVYHKNEIAFYKKAGEMLDVHCYKIYNIKGKKIAEISEAYIQDEAFLKHQLDKLCEESW